LLHLVGDLFELYNDARTYKPYIYKEILSPMSKEAVRNYT